MDLGRQDQEAQYHRRHAADYRAKTNARGRVQDTLLYRWTTSKPRVVRRRFRKIIALSSQFGDVDIQGLDTLLAEGSIKIIDIANMARLMKGTEIQIIEPSFEPATEEEQGQLDHIDNKRIATCPECGHEFRIES
jgi:hypothetical protein